MDITFITMFRIIITKAVATTMVNYGANLYDMRIITKYTII